VRLTSAVNRIGIAAAGLVAGVGGAVLVTTSGHLVRPLAYGVQLGIMIVATTGVALYWARRRPGNRIAVLLLAYAAAAAGMSLQGASDPLLHSIGVFFDAPMFLLGYYLVFAFPTGFLPAVLEKVLLAGVAWSLLATFVPWFLFSPVVSGGAPLARCDASCPHNALMIANRPDLAGGFGTAEEYLAVIVGAAIVLGLLYRLVRASRPRSRALLPVYVPALLLTIPFAIFHAAEVGWLTLSTSAFNTLGWFVTTGRTTLSFGFALAIWQAMLFAGLALRTILSRLGWRDDAGRLQALVADAVDDPALELAFELDHGGKLFVNAQGTPMDPTSAGGGRSATALLRHGEIVAYIVHDAALDTDPEVVQTAGQAILLALENGRLEAELQSKTAELRTSSGRIVEAGEAERRKLERELHDGAQQRLLTIQIKLALLRDRVGESDLATEIDEIGDVASAAVDELRSLAHGIYPVDLREGGIGEGLRAYTRSTPVSIEIVDNGIGRCDPSVEASVYFCALEAIQNAVKHAGRRARVTVTLERTGDTVQFSVDDEGVGFDPGDGSNGNGLGLVSMRDRLAAFGGELDIVSSSGEGTSVRGTVPAYAKARSESPT
jgi:signal transduction histidine kinase